MSIVKENLIKIKNYTPYCGNSNCKKMPRTFFDAIMLEDFFLQFAKKIESFKNIPESKEVLKVLRKHKNLTKKYRKILTKVKWD